MTTMTTRALCVYCDQRHAPGSDCPDRATFHDRWTARDWTVVFVPAGTRFRQHAAGHADWAPPVERDSIAFYDATYAGDARFPEPGQCWGALPVATVVARRGKPWAPGQDHEFVLEPDAMESAAFHAVELAAGRRGAERVSVGPSYGRNYTLRALVRAAEVAVSAGLLGVDEAIERATDGIVDDEVRATIADLVRAAGRGVTWHA